MRQFDQLARDKIRVAKPDGTYSPWLKAVVARKKIFIPSADTVIEEGDIIERETSQGVTEHYDVKEATFHEDFHGIPANYQLGVEKRTKLPKTPTSRTPSSNIHVHGDHNRVLVDSNDESINIVGTNTILHVLDSLTEEVEKRIADDEKLADAKETLRLVRELVEQDRARPGVVETLLKSLPVVGQIGALTQKVLATINGLPD